MLFRSNDASSTATAQAQVLSGGFQSASVVQFDSNGMLNQIVVPPNSSSVYTSTGTVNTSLLNFSNGTLSTSSAFLGSSSQNGSPCNPCTDSVTGISWGRWAQVSVTASDLVNPNSTPVTKTVAGGGVHWISTPSLSGPVTLPISGTYTYGVTGGTNPTDSAGAQGVVNSASLTANFTQQTVNLGVSLTMPPPTGSNTSTSISASASNVPIYKGAEFAASSGSSGGLSVACSGTACRSEEHTSELQSH